MKPPAGRVVWLGGIFLACIEQYRTLQLFDYQQVCVDETRRAYAAGFRAPLLVLPTGGGKTHCFSYMAQQASLKAKRVLLVAHRRELVAQISAALSRFDVAHGIIAPNAKPTGHGVQVAMAQTLVKRVALDRAGRFKFDLVIIDECHHATKDSTWGKILDHNAEAKLLGVSATPCRLDGKGLGIDADGFFDSIIVGPSVEELIRRGRLAQPVVYAPEMQADLSGVKKRGGDFVSGALADAMDKKALTGDAVAHYRSKCAGAPAIAFTVTTAHAAHVVDEFRAGGFSAAVLTGSTPDRERRKMIADLGRGELNLIASCDVISEGTDIPTVVAAILLRPTASYALAMQQMGRALRVADGKDRAYILDHAGNSLRHGLPTESVEWSLQGVTRKTGGGDSVKPCFKCRAMIPKAAAVCPICGHELRAKREMTEAQQETLPMQQAGDLIELTPERRAAMRDWRLREEKNAKTLEDFQNIGRKMGYKRGWANHRYNEVIGGQVNG